MSRSVLSIIGVLVLALVVTACGDTPPPTTGQTAGESEPAAETEAPEETTAEETQAPSAEGGRLATVQERGQLICGVNGELPGFSVVGDDGSMQGFDADFCRAVAAAVLGDAEAVEFRTLSADQRGPALQTGEVDMLARNTTWTVSRDTSWGLFAPTTFYDGQAVMVRAEVGAETFEDLDGATICVQSGTTTELNLADAERQAGIEIQEDVYAEIDPTYQAYEEGACDGVTSDRSQLVARRTEFENPDDHVILDEVLSKEPLGPVAPLGDDEWFNVVKWVVFATIQAEEFGIDSTNVEDTAGSSEDPSVQRFLGVTPEGAEPFESGLGLEADWVVDVISQVGNYAEIFERNLGPETPFELERGQNALWTDGGLLYAPPYR
ncbi:MAG: amino acid ABC transporter substrate-binding protein [Chloroflexota bacterium]|jgi:general L-amino acid transport system substrate-binding protein|nr:amino acid ABC transporter substrate-binding protein [Chloroflexota bacterium]